MRKVLFTGVALAALAGFGAPAHAGATLTFDLMYGIGGALGSINYGTITLTQTASNIVTVSEVLAPGEVYAVTGAGNALDFNIQNVAHLTLTNLTTGFAQGPSPDTANPYGSFNYSIVCTACGNGTSPPNFAAMTFTTNDTNGLSITDFVANAGGYFFASDIGVPNGNGGFNTGNVASKGPKTSVPEPLSLAVLGSGLLGLGLVRPSRRSGDRRQAA